MEEKMDMIINAANFLRDDVVIAVSRGHIGPEARLDFLLDALHAVLCAEYEMDVIPCVGMRHEPPPPGKLLNSGCE
jgi:hypothetical protein